MKSTDILMDEHRVIERAIAVLSRAADKLEHGEKVDPSLFANAVDFIRTFADRCHHAKEEGLLFPRMEDRGFPKHAGPIWVMLEDHEQGRRFVRGLAAAVDRLQQGEADATGEVISNARGYCHLLSQHIPKEDQILYPMADKLFSEDDQRDLIGQFEQAEHEVVGPDGHQRYIELLQSMETAVGGTEQAVA